MRSNNIEELFHCIGFYPVEISAERCVDETPLVTARGYFKAQKAKNLIPNPSRILKSGNRTIVFWNDGTKTIVKRAEDEQDNDYAAFTAALGIRLYGSNSALKRIAERTETQKPKKKETQSKNNGKEYGKWLFDTMMNVAGMKWTCPNCKREYPYEPSEKGIIARCQNCGAYAEIKTGSTQKEDDSNG